LLILFQVLVITDNEKLTRGVSANLSKAGYHAGIAVDMQSAKRLMKETTPCVLIACVNSKTGQVWDICRQIKTEKLPLLALANANNLASLDVSLTNDFAILTAAPEELALRLGRLLRHTGQHIITSGDLIIDTKRCEVTLSGQPVMLAFREYELLKFLATHKGHVFSREALLNKVWGFDFYGGDRTVDVHIRRLRGKIEESGYAFIDTIRNMGYRFRSGNYNLPHTDD